jgi:exosortase/archaeosortase family protein
MAVTGPASRFGELSVQAVLTTGLIGLFLCFALRELQIGTPGGLTGRWANLTIFPWGVFAVAFWRLRGVGNGPAARPLDTGLVTLIAMAAIPLAAESSLAGLGLAIGALGLFTLRHKAADGHLRAAGICLLALCANFTVAPLIFRLGYGHFIGLDMALIQGAIDLMGAPVIATPAGLVAADGHRVMLAGACSSFAGISAAILVHMGWAMMVRTEVGWRDLIAVIATVLIATALNIIRLTLTASGQEAYAYWHGALGETPLGGQIFWFAHNAVLLAGGYLSAKWAGGPALRRAMT